MQAEIAYRLAAREAQAQTWRNLAYRLETLVTTGVVIFTLGNLMIPGLNQTTTDWYLAQTWLLGTGQLDTAAIAPQGVAVQDSEITQTVVEGATRWLGKSFKPGEKAQCAYFVRDVLKEAGIPVEVTTNPRDGVLPVNEGHANSFFGEDVGDIIEKPDDLRAGDLVMFANTYGDFPPGTVTHVGIYVADGKMIDRSTSDEPVNQRSISIFKFAAGVRPHGYAKAQPSVATAPGQQQPTGDRPSETTPSSEAAKQYFKQLKGGEWSWMFGQHPLSPLPNAQIEILGDTTEEDLKTIEVVVQELRAMGATGLQLVPSGGNVQIHFADPAQFSRIEPNYKAGNLGFFSHDGDRGKVLITSASTTLNGKPTITQQERSHLIREELTQLITGLGKDSEQYPDSIFYQQWTDTTQYSELDKAVIRMALNP